MATSVENPEAQFVALASNLDRTAAFGIPPERVFGFGEYIGGRYSIWGPIGLSLMLAIGPSKFAAFLAGGAEMDTHFKSAPLNENLPVLLALTGIWHHQAWDIRPVLFCLMNTACRGSLPTFNSLRWRAMASELPNRATR